MHAVCSICGDIFTGLCPEVVHTTLCGHLFHYACLDQWLQRSKTCPQCRSRVTEEKTVKLYFHVNTYQLSTEDRVPLENELQSVKYELILKNMDIKKLTEEKELAKNQTDGLRTRLLKREEQLRNHETVVSSLQDQVKILKSQMKSLNDLQIRAEELQNKLKQYKSVEVILNGSAADTLEHLERVKDRTDPTILCTCINTLKKEIEHYKDVEKSLRSNFKLTEVKLTSALAELENLRKEHSVINRCFIKVKQDLQNSEKEIESLKKKCKHLEESISEGSNSSNPRDKALRRFINEYPTPQLKNISTDDLNITSADLPVEDRISPSSPDRLYSFNKIRNKTMLNKRRLAATSSSDSHLQCYDGFGGTAREEQQKTDRAELFNAINNSKPIKLSYKRTKVSSKNGVQKSDLFHFYAKKP